MELLALCDDHAFPNRMGMAMKKQHRGQMMTRTKQQQQQLDRDNAREMIELLALCIDHAFPNRLGMAMKKNTKQQQLHIGDDAVCTMKQQQQQQQVDCIFADDVNLWVRLVLQTWVHG